MTTNKAGSAFTNQHITGSPIWQIDWWSSSDTLESKWRSACRSVMDGNHIRFTESILSSQEKIDIVFLLSPMTNDAGKVTQVFIELGLPSANPSRELTHEVNYTHAHFEMDHQDIIDRVIPNNIPLTSMDVAHEDTCFASEMLQAKNQQDALIESEQNFRLMVESIEDYAMFMVDLEGFITSWNRGAERLTGYSDIEAIGRHFSMLYPHQLQNKEYAANELAMAQAHGRHEEEGLRMRKDGTHYHAQIIVWRIEDAAGNTVGYAKITHDITARKDAEHALKASEAKFRTMTDAMPQIVWSALPDGRNDYINQRWYEFSGAAHEPLAGEEWFDRVHPDEKVQVSETWGECIKNTSNFEAQLRLLNAAGNYRWTLARALPVLTDAKVTRWMGTLTDIQEQKQAEATLRESARRKDEYLAMLAHELRNPLAPIRNSTVLLKKMATDEPNLLKPIDVIDRQIAHMTRLIDDLLDVARISRGKIELKKQTFELGELIAHTVNDFKTEYDLKGIELTLETHNHLCWIYADRIRIAQAVGNLLHNALKFTDIGGKVVVSLDEEMRGDRRFGVVKVKDTGIGIDPQLSEQLFQPFAQGHQDLARSKGGLGLGLALIRGFVDLHGGTVHVISAGTGQGAEFIFAIPLSSSPGPHEQTVVTSKIAAPLKVVLIDDNKDMVETLATLLSMDGHNVKYAYDGESGLTLIKNEKPDLIFCDIGLPGSLDGYAVARNVRMDETIANTFIVAISGYGQERDKQLAFESGFNDHLLKPIDFDVLSKVIANNPTVNKAMRKTSA